MENRYPNPTRKLRPPDDGIFPSNRPKTWLGLAWNRIVTSLGREHSSRLAKGRGLARSGRVRALWFSPGLAHAEVYDTEVFQISLRVEVLSDEQWNQVTTLLHSHLELVAALLEGTLSPDLMSLLAQNSLQLLPEDHEIAGDCDCPDYMSLCPHMAAVHLVLSDALEGDPFLLLNLRGRTQQQLIRSLCQSWGDNSAFQNPKSEETTTPPDAETWFRSPEPIDLTMRFKIRHLQENTLAGLAALGPPPGRADLTTALAPLYTAGAESAAKLALTTSNTDEQLIERLTELITALQPVRLSILCAHLERPAESIVEALHRLEALEVINKSDVDLIPQWRLK
jgi:uncharacterized Zn finger protein